MRCDFFRPGSEAVLRWKKMKEKDVPQIENVLRDRENDCVTACGRFLEREVLRENVWILRAGKEDIAGLLINSRSTLIPVLCGLKEIPDPDFLKSFFRIKKIHSVQGIRDEVYIFENALEKMGKTIVDIFDYDLMTLDNLPLIKDKAPSQMNLVLRIPQLVDLDGIAPLQAAYEQEEVLPKGSVFSPAASRINIANIIKKRQILAAELNGKLIGKINVSSVSFTRFLIGGVYVHPDFRGMGIARRMAAEFTSSLISQGKGITLFVKKSNLAARRLYTGLGFSVRKDYRITYY
jgi:hypothetical protein